MRDIGEVLVWKVQLLVWRRGFSEMSSEFRSRSSPIKRRTGSMAISDHHQEARWSAKVKISTLNGTLKTS